MIKPEWLKWTAPVAGVLAIAGLISATVRAAGSERALSQVGGLALVMLSIGIVVAAILLPPRWRQATLERRFPQALVYNIRRTGSLGAAIGARVPMRPTLVASRTQLTLYRGYLRPVLLWQADWSRVARLEIGSARELYLSLESVDVLMKDGRKVVLPIDDRFAPVGGQRLEAIASALGDIGRVPVALS